MKHHSKSILSICVIFCIFATFSIFAIPKKVDAVTVDSVSTLQDLQSKIESSMNSRLTSYTIDYTGNSSTINPDITNIINNIFNADDYLHYTSKGYSFSYSISGNITTLNFTFSYWNTADQDSYVNTMVTQILSQIITPDMNIFEKERKIHDWIEKNVAYDTTLINHSDYAALVSPYKTVCQGYALLSYKMLNQAGIETKIVEGTADGSAHAWNLVNIDGSWYHFDATWDDPIPDVIGRTTYSYYNLTDAQIRTNHSWVKTYPSASTDFSSTLNSKLVSDPTNASIYQGLIDALNLNLLSDQYTVNDSVGLNDKIQQAISNHKNNIEVRYLKGSTLSTDIATAIKGIGTISSYSYSKTDCIRSSIIGDVILDLTFVLSSDSAASPTPSLETSQVKVTNNVDTNDIVDFTGLTTGEKVMVYSMSGKLLGTATASATGLAKITLAAQLPKTDQQIQVSALVSGKTQSERTNITYDAEAITETPTINITNNVDIADEVKFIGLKTKDIATVYAKDGITKLGSATCSKDGDLIIKLSKQLSEDDLLVNVTVKSYNKNITAQIPVSYDKQKVTATPIGLNDLKDNDGNVIHAADTVITNNVDKADTLKVSGLLAGDIVTLYSSDGKTVLGKATATTSSTVTLTLSKQLSEINRTVYVSIKSKNLMESTKTELDYIAQNVTPALTTDQMFVTNNALLIAGLTAGDKISVYSSSTTGTKSLTTVQVSKGKTYAVVTFANQKTGTKLYVTNKSDNKVESDQLAVTTP